MTRLIVGAVMVYGGLIGIGIICGWLPALLLFVVICGNNLDRSE